MSSYNEIQTVPGTVSQTVSLIVFHRVRKISVEVIAYGKPPSFPFRLEVYFPDIQPLIVDTYKGESNVREFYVNLNLSDKDVLQHVSGRMYALGRQPNCGYYFTLYPSGDISIGETIKVLVERDGIFGDIFSMSITDHPSPSASHTNHL